jgi:hypothetical protein
VNCLVFYHVRHPALFPGFEAPKITADVYLRSELLTRACEVVVDAKDGSGCRVLTSCCPRHQQSSLVEPSFNPAIKVEPVCAIDTNDLCWPHDAFITY